MTAAEVMVASAGAGIQLELGDSGQLVIMADRGRLAPEIKAALIHHRDRLAAALKLRAVHRKMGLGEDDVAMIEEALLSGRVSEIQIAVRAPEGPPA